MKKSYLKLTAVIFAALTIAFTACDDDSSSEKVEPTLVSVSLSADNATATVYFSEPVYSVADMTGALTDDDFTIALSGGDLTLESSAVTHTAGSSSATIDLTYSADFTDGADLLTVSVAADNIYDADGQTVAAASVNDNLSAREGLYITENISTDATWTEGNIYILATRVTVLDGATLTIEPGVVIKGAAGTGANATALLVASGGTLLAQGTAEKPIIMTTIADAIEPGAIVSPNNMDPSFNGAWGGLIVLGEAPISADATPFQIEGIPSSDENGLYGGSTSNDYSGTIQYISIRHGGSNIGEGNEINGITLGGVGSETIINHIEVVANQDDGIECFGGTVDVDDILVWNSGDDAFDMDQDYTGTIDNFIGIMGDETDHAMELDGPEGAADNGGFTLTNGSLKGWNDEGEDGGEFADLRSGCKCIVSNCYFFNFSVSADFELDNNGVAANYEAGDITLSGLQFNFYLDYDDDGTTVVVQENADVDLTDIFLDKGDDASDAFAVTGMTPSDIASKVSTPTVGATKSEFTGWTWAHAAGELADF